MKDESTLLVKIEGRICTLVINRPQKRNLLTSTCLYRMAEVFKDLSREGTVRAVIIRGAGEHAFSAGYDISSLPIKPSSDKVVSSNTTSPLETALQAIRRFPYPVIAMINGVAFGGGCELAIGCDIRIAATRTKMGMTAVKLGIAYRYTGYRRFLTVLGFSRTLEIFLTGRKYDSQSCLLMGLVNYVTENDKIESYVHDLAGEISENAPLSLQCTKSTLYKIAEYPVLHETEEEKLRALFFRSMQSEDIKEGKQAFLEKRQPHFKGK